jgi:hypothetical protein
VAPSAHAARAPIAYEGDLVVPVDPKELEKFCRRHNAITGDLIFNRDYAGRDLSAMSCVHRVDGRLVIKKTPHVESLEGLDLNAMAGVPLKSLRIVDNDALVDVSGLSQLRAAKIVIQDNRRLQVISGLPTIVGSTDLTVTNNVDLVELEAPDGHRRSTRLGTVDIQNNPRLVTVRGFDRVVAARSVSLRANARLRELDGFSQLTDVGTFELVGLPMLEAWTAAPRITTIGEYVVEDCDGLRRLPGLPDLTRLGRVTIAENGLLEDVSGLTASRAGHPTVDRVTLMGNAHLSDQAVAQLLDRLHLPADGGAVRVENNGMALRRVQPEPSDAGVPQGVSGAAGE